jgi:hypothetical protein
MFAKNLKPLFLLSLIVLSMHSKSQSKIVITTETLKDKIKGAWAGQTIGVTYGGPMEFRYNGTMINPYQPIHWDDLSIKRSMTNDPGLYDDLYMDITFVEVMEKEGLHAPITSHAKAFANAEYPLWHANQAARYNILNGIMPPASGQWQNNPHSDCIDFQIEADFAGILSPAMPNAAIQLATPIGHIMNYGDGFYGGAFVSACYANAYYINNVETIIKNAIATIPSNSLYYKVINDVIHWYHQYPNDWKNAWFEVQKKYTQDIGCPEGIFKPYNIDATVNSAYVVIGLLYGHGDFAKTMDITTRCGQDADCNPSTAAGILGTMMGYANIPEKWKKGIEAAENIDFKYTHSSLKKLYEVSFNLAMEHLKENGAITNGANISIPIKKNDVIPFEQSLTNVFPIKRIEIQKNLTQSYQIDFEGDGFMLTGETAKWASTDTSNFHMQVILDGKLIETAKLPVSYRTRRYELAWKYNIPIGKHHLELVLLDPNPKFDCRLQDLIVYQKQ